MKVIQKVFITVLLIAAMIVPPLTPLSLHPVTVQAASLEINKTKATLKVGDTLNLKLTGTSKKITWSTSDNSIAKVSSKGKVTAKASGTATITASVGGSKLSCKVTVVDAASSATKKRKK